MVVKRKVEAERKVEPESKADQDALAFAQKLVWQMDSGTRADGRNRRWTAKGLAAECGVSDRTVRNWRNGTYRADIETLDRLFFGADPKHTEARGAFRALWAVRGNGIRELRSSLSYPVAIGTMRADWCRSRFVRRPAVLDATAKRLR